MFSVVFRVVCASRSCLVFSYASRFCHFDRIDKGAKRRNLRIDFFKTQNISFLQELPLLFQRKSYYMRFLHSSWNDKEKMIYVGVKISFTAI